MKPEVSALADGALDDSACEATLKAMKQDETLRQTWATYHLIGDALRDELATDQAGHGLSSDFTDRFMAALADEPTVLAPPVKPLSTSGRLSRFLLPLAASVMGVGAVAWVAQSTTPSQPAALASGQPSVQTTQVAQADQAAPLPSRPMNEYLVAHEGYSPRGSIQGVAYYVRGVSDTRPGGER